MIIVQKQSNNFIVLNSGQNIVENNGIIHPWNIVDLWSDAQLATLNIFRVKEPSIPEGQEISGPSKFEMVNGTVEEILTLSPISIPTTNTPTLPEVAPIVSTIIPDTLEETKRKLLKKLTSEWNQIDIPYTYGVGQATIYAAKVKEATQFLTDVSQKLNNFPFITAHLKSSKLEYGDPEALAQEWKNNADNLTKTLLPLEIKRAEAKKGIENAKDANTAQAAFESFAIINTK